MVVTKSVSYNVEDNHGLRYQFFKDGDFIIIRNYDNKLEIPYVLLKEIMELLKTKGEVSK